MSKAQRINIFASAYHKLKDITTMTELKQNKLTLAELDIVFDMMKDMSDISGKVTKTAIKGAAEWFQRHGFSVQQNGILWEVSI